MCLLSVFSPTAVGDMAHLEAGAKCNPDGFGFAVIVGDRIETGKGMVASAVIESFERIRSAHPHSWALFHSRYTTHGETSVDNCHPFVVGQDGRTVLAHNGILPRSAQPGPKDDRSDTRILAEDLIPRRRFGRLYRARSRKNLERWLTSEGYPNKVAILTTDPRYKGPAFILNERAGEWVDGVWHSNGGWKPRPKLSAYDWTSEYGQPSSAYQAYRNGEITYGEYLDAVYTGSNPDDCELCDSRHTVNTVYGYCRACKHCVDCFAHIDACDCYQGADASVVAAALNDDGRVPMALTSVSEVPGDNGEHC